MKKNYLRTILLVGLLMAVTVAGLAYSKNSLSPAPAPTPAPTPPVAGPAPDPSSGKAGVVGLTGKFTQGKVQAGGDGLVSLALTMTADRVPDSSGAVNQNVDMVVVLDRSGSMGGQKINDAKTAILQLMDSLSDKDRFALVIYSDQVNRVSPLMYLTPGNKENLAGLVRNVFASGSTNLGGGMQEGIQVLAEAGRVGNLGRVILISDGLANQGITDPAALAQMAASASRKEYTVSTVGVGSDFNEQLMTSIADHGTGNYHYLDDAARFAEVFQKEFMSARVAAATGVEIHLPLPAGVTVVSASGYPIDLRGQVAVIRPGDLLSGAARTLYLTLKVPAAANATYDFQGIRLAYLNQGALYSVSLDKPLTVAVAADERDVFASYDKEQWEKKVIQEDYNRLREEVAADIRKGDQAKANERITDYRSQQAAANAVVQSQEVTRNLEEDLDQLETLITDSFSGSADEAAQKQKVNSKSLQFKSYGERRAK